MSKFFYILTIVFGFTILNVESSNGDRSQHYRICLQKCFLKNCTEDMSFKENPPLELKLLLWTCEDDCRYLCMWETVNFFTSQGQRVPQFHGKWPFVRFFGLQEPASVIFSLLNLMTHFGMYRRLKQAVRPSNPMYLVWVYFSLICMNGWIWSAIFHARDTPFTEVMDYSCAFALVLTSLYCITLRITLRSSKAFAILSAGYVLTLLVHLSHLWSGRINYGYNMKLNIALGLVTFLATISWWYRNRRKLEHSALIAWFNVFTVLVTLLEVADFPPLLWTFDAHSLWHASTAPLAILFYRFIIQDCKYLQRTYEKSLINSD